MDPQPMTGVRTITGPPFITTTPSLTRCRPCGARVLAATITGLDHHIDPLPLTTPGELHALLAHRRTYDLRRDHLSRRTVHHIRAGRPHPVLADHQCRPTPADHIDHGHLPQLATLIQHLIDPDHTPTGGPDEPPPF